MKHQHTNRIRSGRGEAIICPVCKWHPPGTYFGGVRWKLMAHHIANHVSKMETRAKGTR